MRKPPPQRHEERMDVRGTATASGADNILAGPANSSMLSRAAADSARAPLSALVMCYVLSNPTSPK